MVSCRDQDGAVAQSKIVVNGLLIDLDVDGFISEEEVLISIEKFFKAEELNGVKLDRRQLFLHLEAFLMK